MSNKTILIIAILAVVFVSCKKAADVVQGVYVGTVYVNSSDAGNGTATISMVSDNVVNMNFVITGDTIIDYLNVAVAGVENPYSLSYHATNGNMYGQVTNNDLTFTFYDTSGVQTSFIGSK